MKKIIYALSTVVLAFSLASCNDFLTVNPESDYPDYMFLTTEKGLQDALVGLYTMASEDNYAPGDSPVFAGFHKPDKDVGLIEIIGGFWKVDCDWSEMASQLYLHIYTGQKTKKNIESYFVNQYKIVANANQILRWIDDSDQELDRNSDNYKIIKGEALAMKAFILFDLIRTFGPSPADAGRFGQAFLPYPQDMRNSAYPTISYNEFMEKLIGEINEAESLLKAADPIRNKSKAALDGGEVWFQKRYTRMNYYAACALKARILLWEGKDLTEASRCANEVIEASQQFGFRPIANYDERGAEVMPNEEMVFGLAFGKTFTYSLTEPTLEDYEAAGESSKGRLSRLFGASSIGNGPDYTRLQAIFPAGDVRFNKMSTTENTIVNNRMVTKWYPFREARATNLIPMIRLSEMYLIQAECESTVSGAMSWINSLREHKISGYTAPDASGMTNEEFEDELVKEYIREFWGEGQLFYCYKRLGLDHIPYPSMMDYSSANYPSFAGPISMNFDKYILPKPATEVSGSK